MFLSFLRELVYCSAFKQHVFCLNYINILFPRPSVTSSKVSSCLNRLYQSLANLIRWSDQVMLEGVNLEDKETVTTVTTVIKAVLDGVKVLIVYRTSKIPMEYGLFSAHIPAVFSHEFCS